MRAARVPWSAGTSALVRLGLELLESGGGAAGGGAGKEQLEEQQRLVTLKVILKKHGIHVKFSDHRSAEVRPS